jgi:hypothetical protein
MMPYVQGSALSKVFAGSLEAQTNMIKDAISEHYGDSPVNIVSVHTDHAFGFDVDGKFLRFTYTVEDGVVKNIDQKPSKAVRVWEDNEVPLFVSKQLKSMVNKMMRGKPIERTQVREVASVIQRDEDYWLSGVLAKLDEATGEAAEWTKMYEANKEQIRTSLHGHIREYEGRLPKTRYSKIGADKISEFENELRESFGVVNAVLQQIVDECTGIVFDKERDEFFGAIRKSLIAEAQTVVGLLGKAEKLMGSEDLESMSMAHDRLAEWAKTMVVVAEYLKDKARPDNEE